MGDRKIRKLPQLLFTPWLLSFGTSILSEEKGPARPPTRTRDILAARKSPKDTALLRGLLLRHELQSFVTDVLAAPRARPADFLHGGVGIELGQRDRIAQGGNA